MKRFVSYLYSIYNNQKIHNAGFARMELRTGRNRVDIHLKENGYSGKTGTVYLFVRKQENIQGIPIGNITFRGSQADFRYEQSEENIGQTHWQIMQMNGILIVIDDRAAFLSQWDEQPVDTTRFEVWNVDKMKEDTIKEEGLKKEDQNEDNLNGSNLKEGHLHEKNRDKSGLKEEHLHEKNRNKSGLKEEHLIEKNQNEDSIKEEHLNGKNQNDSNLNEGNRKEKPVESEHIIQHGQRLAQKPYLQPGPQASVQTEIKTAPSAVHSGVGNGHSQEQPMNIQTAELQPQVRNQWNQTWRYMLRMYPVLNQFTDNNQILCVRIEIKDVRLLPEKYWSMVNNSFLLHGFFNYRYLAFGKIGQNWFIGIPGVYQNQEHVMASIFGFPDFLPQSQKNERGEQPGYWYRILEI